MNERIKAIIKEKGIKKTEFAQKLNVSQAYISQLCSGTKTPSDRTIADICREFNVSETWLRTGEGRPFVELPRNEALAAQIKTFLQSGTDSFRERLVSLLLRLAPEQWDALESYLMELIDAPAPAGDSKQETTAQTNPDLAAKVAELERQNAEKDKQLQELSARLSAMEEEDELNWPSDTGNLA